jgi:hypothetical protein
VEQQVDEWLDENLPQLRNAPILYSYEEIQDYLRFPPRKETQKLLEMRHLENFTRAEIDEKIKNRLDYVMSKIKVIDAHFASETSVTDERTHPTPQKSDFNIISVDIVSCYNEHKFLFANPKHLEASSDAPNHLQQNYVIGFVFTQPDGSLMLNLDNEWREVFNDISESLSPDDAVNEVQMQID